METLLKAELTELLEYEKYTQEGRNSGNSRNGYYDKSYETKDGKTNELKTLRDRLINFNSNLFSLKSIAMVDLKI